MAKVQPLAERIVAEPQVASEKTSAGIYLPTDAKEKPKTAKVVAVGKDVKEVKVGDVVLHSSYGGDTVKVDNTEYIILKEEDVLAVIK
jgi:chaperonin GroES